jgi:hypothetical protein
MHKRVTKCVFIGASKNLTTWSLLGGVLQVALINVFVSSSVFLLLYTIKPCFFNLCMFLIKDCYE